MDTPKEAISVLEGNGWYQRGNGTWSNHRYGNLHTHWFDAVARVYHAQGINATISFLRKRGDSCNCADAVESMSKDF